MTPFARHGARRLFLGIAGLVPAVALSFASAATETSVSATIDRNRAAVGEQIVLTVTVASTGDVPSVVPPERPNIPNVNVSGPLGPSTSQEFTLSGSTAARRTTVSYLFYLSAQRQGQVVIPAMAVLVDGKSYQTNPIRVTIGAADAGAGASPIEVRVNVSRKRAYIGQEIVIEYVLYEQTNGPFRVTNRQITDEPNFSGFWVETLLDARQGQVPQSQQVVNGVAYTVVPLLRVAAFPTSSRSLAIPPLGMTAVVMTPTGSRNFWGDPIYQQRTLSVSSPSRTIEVLPLPPNPPAGFGGAVGEFRLTSAVDRTEMTQGDPVTWTVTIEGEGNLKAIGDLLLPPLPEFRAYDPQVTTNLSPSTEQLAGRKVYERVLIPLHSGPQAIPPASFVFFDPEAERYRTITSERHPITVHPSETPAAGPLVFGVNQAEIRQVGRDIRFIKPDATKLVDQTRTIWHARWYWAANAAPILLVALAGAVRWRRSRLGRDPVRLRAMAAGAEARRRLRTARSHLKRGDLRETTGALGNAVRELVAGHADTGAAGLTVDRIRTALAERNVSEDLIDETLGFLAECDRARYSPGGISDEAARGLYEASYSLVRRLARHLTP